MRFKWVFRRDEIQRHYRLFRLLWTRGQVGDSHGYSAKLSVALAPSVWSGPTRHGGTDWLLTVLGVRMHYCRSYGGVIV